MAWDLSFPDWANYNNRITPEQFFKKIGNAVSWTKAESTEVPDMSAEDREACRLARLMLVPRHQQESEGLWGPSQWSEDSGPRSSVSGGGFNTASGFFSSVSGGLSNTASNTYSSVSGGRLNTANGRYSSVGGGGSRSALNTDDWRAGSLFEDN